MQTEPLKIPYCPSFDSGHYQVGRYTEVMLE